MAKKNHKYLLPAAGPFASQEAGSKTKFKKFKFLHLKFESRGLTVLRVCNRAVTQ